VAPNWSLGVEYNHIFLRHRDVTFTGSVGFGGVPAGAFTRRERIGQDVDIGLVRLNYRWSGSSPNTKAWRALIVCDQ
jgi:outer membrane immunogenic protein